MLRKGLAAPGIVPAPLFFGGHVHWRSASRMLAATDLHRLAHDAPGGVVF